MGAPREAVGYRPQLATTYLEIRVWVGVAATLSAAAIAAIAALPGRWLVVAVVAGDLLINVYEQRRVDQRAIVSLVSMGTMFGLLDVIIRIPALMGASLVFMIVTATVLVRLEHALAITAYVTVWTVAGLLVLRSEGPAATGNVSTFVADAIAIAALGAATLVIVGGLTRRLDLFDHLRSRLIGNVSHELRTPLTGLHGLASVLQDNYRDLSQAEIDEFLDLLVLESAEATVLVEDLLTAVRPTEHLRIHGKPIQVDAEIRAVLATLAPIMSKPVKLVDDSTIEAYADPTRVRQIVRNLLTNAERYGGPHIEIHLEQIGGEVLISVCDDGPGIPPAEREAVFDEWKGTDIGAQHPQSIGLGLTISRRLAQAMGGDLRYDYIEGESRFVLSLPVEGPSLRTPQA